VPALIEEGHPQGMPLRIKNNIRAGIRPAFTKIKMQDAHTGAHIKI